MSAQARARRAGSPGSAPGRRTAPRCGRPSGRAGAAGSRRRLAVRGVGVEFRDLIFLPTQRRHNAGGEGRQPVGAQPGQRGQRGEPGGECGVIRREPGAVEQDDEQAADRPEVEDPGPRQARGPAHAGQQ